MALTRAQKSLLFGYHAIWIHGFFVLWAWIKTYSRWPKLAELIAIFLHDIGYWRCINMHDADGIEHPAHSFHMLQDVTKFLRKLGLLVVIFPVTNSLILSHSREYINSRGWVAHGVGPLAYPDKLAFLLYPRWLIKLLVTWNKEYLPFESFEKWYAYHHEKFSAWVATNKPPSAFR